MATWEDVRQLALGLPETSEAVSRGTLQWKVEDKLFVWERPLRKSDLLALGAEAPEGPILGARVAHEGVKLALVEENPAVYFTTPHFNGYPAILAQLDAISLPDLEALIVDAWHDRAPARLARPQPTA